MSVYNWEGGCYLISPLLAREGLFHFFGARRLADTASLGLPATAYHLRQVHGDRVCLVDRDGEPEGDGLTTNRADMLLTISTADCAPILLFDPVQRAISAIHAGWRGTLLGIVKKGVREMGRHFGSHPPHLIAAIGPAIGRCCYEVGAAVWEQVDPTHRDAAVTRKAGEKAMLDLPRLNALQLEEAGLMPAQISVCDLCTACAPESFYSYRREGKTGRMLSGIALKEGRS